MADSLNTNTPIFPQAAGQLFDLGLPPLDGLAGVLGVTLQGAHQNTTVVPTLDIVRKHRENRGRLAAACIHFARVFKHSFPTDPESIQQAWKSIMPIANEIRAGPSVVKALDHMVPPDECKRAQFALWIIEFIFEMLRIRETLVLAFRVLEQMKKPVFAMKKRQFCVDWQNAVSQAVSWFEEFAAEHHKFSQAFPEDSDEKSEEDWHGVDALHDKLASLIETWDHGFLFSPILDDTFSNFGEHEKRSLRNLPPMGTASTALWYLTSCLHPLRAGEAPDERIGWTRTKANEALIQILDLAKRLEPLLPPPARARPDVEDSGFLVL